MNPKSMLNRWPGRLAGWEDEPAARFRILACSLWSRKRRGWGKNLEGVPVAHCGILVSCHSPQNPRRAAQSSDSRTRRNPIVVGGSKDGDAGSSGVVGSGVVWVDRTTGVVGDVRGVCEQYCSPLCVVRGRTRRG